MDSIIQILDFTESHIGIILTICGLLFAWHTYQKERKAKIVIQLAKQVIAYYCVEQEAIKMISELTNESEQTIQRQLRKKALDNENNLETVRPVMSATGARKFL